MRTTRARQERRRGAMWSNRSAGRPGEKYGAWSHCGSTQRLRRPFSKVLSTPEVKVTNTVATAGAVGNWLKTAAVVEPRLEAFRDDAFPGRCTACVIDFARGLARAKHGLVNVQGTDFGEWLPPAAIRNLRACVWQASSTAQLRVHKNVLNRPKPRRSPPGDSRPRQKHSRAGSARE